MGLFDFGKKAHNGLQKVAESAPAYPGGPSYELDDEDEDITNEDSAGFVGPPRPNDYANEDSDSFVGPKRPSGYEDDASYDFVGPRRSGWDEQKYESFPSEKSGGFPSLGWINSEFDSSGLDIDGNDNPRGGTGGLKFVGPLREKPQKRTSHYENALRYEGVPYKWAGRDEEGVDCSGLVCLATNSKERWTTGGGHPPGNYDKVAYNPLEDGNLSSFAKKGDLLVWPPHKDEKGKKISGHTAFFSGGNTLFHAHGNEGNPTGFTNNLTSHWLKNKGFPDIYREKDEDEDE